MLSVSRPESEERSNLLRSYARLNYKAELTGTPSFVTGDGDGTVNARSLRSCEKWAGTKAQNGKRIHSMEMPRADHMGILSDKRVVEYVLKVLVGDVKYDPEASEIYDIHNRL